MKFKSLEKVTRSQVDKMLYDDLELLVNNMEREIRAEQWRTLVKDALEKQEAQIVTPKVVS